MLYSQFTAISSIFKTFEVDASEGNYDASYNVSLLLQLFGCPWDWGDLFAGTMKHALGLSEWNRKGRCMATFQGFEMQDCQVWHQLYYPRACTKFPNQVTVLP